MMIRLCPGHVETKRVEIMTFKHACFISYPHSKSERPTEMEQFVHELKELLENQFAPFLDEDVVIDKELLAGGDRFNETLPQAICKSLCMVVVYAPIYEKRTFCLQEYRAMEDLEIKRLKLAEKSKPGECGMIIPIIYRGAKDDLPADIKNNIHYLDFSEYTLASPKIGKNREYVAHIRRLAEKIHKLHRLFENLEPCKDCDEFALPDANNVQPFRSSGNPKANPFPGS